jgi:hypothetical protein
MHCVNRLGHQCASALLKAGADIHKKTYILKDNTFGSVWSMERVLEEALEKEVAEQ